jgi:hypothetical protein
VSIFLIPYLAGKLALIVVRVGLSLIQLRKLLKDELVLEPKEVAACLTQAFELTGDFLLLKVIRVTMAGVNGFSVLTILMLASFSLILGV